MTDQSGVVVRGLSDELSDLFAEGLEVVRSKRAKNMLLSTYYDSHQALKDLGVSIPPQLSNVGAALGWPSRAVNALARKHKFQGFSLDGQSDPFDVNEVLHQNSFTLELTQAISSAYKHGVSFLVTTAGNESDGEPAAVVTARDAEQVGAVWDTRRNQIKTAVIVLDTNAVGLPTEALFFSRREWFHVFLEHGGWIVQDKGFNESGRPMVEALVYDPQLNRPFGHSRITREVRYLTDAAIRAMVRAETTAEFFASPQRYVLGASEDAFADGDRWTAIMGRVLALGTNEEGEKPAVGQFPAQPPEQMWSTYRQLAQNFCAATGLPQSQVGIFADNPTSAEAMQTAEAGLAEEAEYQWGIFGPALVRTLGNVATIAHGTAPTELSRVMVNHEPARYVSPSSASNWAVQAVQSDPTLSGTRVILRRIGLSEGEIDEIRSDQSRGEATSVLDQLMCRVDGTGDEQNPDAGETEVKNLTDRANALGALIRAGVTPESAKREVGLPNLEFYEGDRPVTIRDREDGKGDSGGSTAGELE